MLWRVTMVLRVSRKHCTVTLTNTTGVTAHLVEVFGGARHGDIPGDQDVPRLRHLMMNNKKLFTPIRQDLI